MGDRECQDLDYLLHALTLIFPEPILRVSMKMKIITKRHGIQNPLEGARQLLTTIRRLRGHTLTIKGVFRFKTFQESNDWMTEQMAHFPERYQQNSPESTDSDKKPDSFFKKLKKFLS